MKKVVLKLDFADEKTKQKAMKRVSGVSGLESIALDPKDKKLTVTGDIDPVALVAKLRKLCHTEIVSVGPPEKKKEEPKKEEKKDEPKKDQPKEDQAAQLRKAIEAYNQQLQHHYYYQQHHHQYQPYQQPPVAAVAPQSYFNRSVEEDPNACVIC